MTIAAFFVFFTTKNTSLNFPKAFSDLHTNYLEAIPSSTHFPKHCCKFIPSPPPATTTTTMTKSLIELATAS